MWQQAWPGPRVGIKASIQTGRGWNQSRREKATTKYPAGPGSILSRACFSRPKGATTPPSDASTCYICRPLPTTFSCPATSNLHPSPAGLPTEEHKGA